MPTSVHSVITGITVAPHCCNVGHSKINRKISTPCRITSPQNFILKYGKRDYIGDKPHMQILGQIGSAGGSPQIREI